MFNEELIDGITDSITNLDTRVGELERKETLTKGDGIGPFRYEVHVDINGDGDFTSVKDACDYVAAQPNVGVDEWLIWIHPGDYDEDPFTPPAFTTLWGIGGDVYIDSDTLTSSFITIIESGVTFRNIGMAIAVSPTTQDVFLITCTGGDFLLDNCRISLVVATPGAFDAGLVKCVGSGAINFSDCQFEVFNDSIGMLYALHLDVADGQIENYIRSCRIWRTSSSPSRGIFFSGDGGKLYLLETTILPESTDIYVDTDATVYLRATNYATGDGPGDIEYMYASGPGTGTVTSVALSAPSIFNLAGSPITTSGTLALTLANQAANSVFAGPVSGAAAPPEFRILDEDDIPTLSPSKISGSVVTGTGTDTYLTVWNSASTVTGYQPLKYDDVNLGLMVGRAAAITTAYSGFPINDDLAVLQLGQDNSVSTSDSYGVLLFSHDQTGNEKVLGSIFWANRAIAAATKLVAAIDAVRATANDSAYIDFWTMNAGVFAERGRMAPAGALLWGKTSGLASSGDLDIAGNANIDGTLDATGAVEFASTLDVTGAVDFDSTLNVDGASTYGGNMTLSKASGATLLVESTSGAGATFTLNSPSGFNAVMNFQSPAGDQSTLNLRSGGDSRWVIVKNADTESGSNVGGNFELRRRTDAGGVLSTSIFIERSTGLMGINRDTATATHQLDVNGNFRVALADAATNSITEIARITHTTSGTAAAGFGSRLLWTLESSTGADQNAIATSAVWTVATNATRTSELRILSVTNAAALAEVARFDGGGGATPAAGNTGFMIWDVDNNTLERVTVGAAGSGGVGFKVLRIPN